MSDFPPPETLEPPRPTQPYGPPLWVRPEVPPARSAITERERRWWTGVPTAVWIGLVGSTLILAASMFVVVARWDSIGRGLRSIGVAAITVGLILAAYRLKRVTPTMASIIVHLGAALTTMVGIAVVSMFGLTWPTCIAVGGAVGFGVCAWLERTWQPSRFAYIEVANVVASATGLAALTRTTAGLWIVGAAVGCSLIGWRHRSVALSVLAVSTPISAIAAAAGVGPGTLERAGMIGDRLMWSAPIVGLIAGAIVMRAGRKLGRSVIVVCGASLPLIGFATGLAASDAPGAVWWSLPGVVLIALNLGLELNRAHAKVDEKLELGIDLAAGFIAAVGAMIALAAAPSTDVVTVAGVDIGAGPWVVPAVATLIGVVTTIYRWRRSSALTTAARDAMVDAGLAAAVALAYATFVVINLPGVAVAVAVLATAATATAVSTRRSPILVGPAFLVVVWACARIDTAHIGFGFDTAERLVAVAVTAVALVGAILLRARRAGDSGALGFVEVAALLSVASISIAAFSGWTFVPTLVAVMALATSLTTMLDRRYFGLQAAALAAVGVVAVETYAVLGLQSWPWAIGFGVAALAVAAVVINTDDTAVWIVTPSMVAAALAAATTVTGLRAYQLDPTTVLTVSCAVAVAVTGMWVVSRLDALGVYAVTVSVFSLLLISSYGVGAWWGSALVMLIGVQVAALGLRLDTRPVIGVGLAIFVGGAISLTVTTPLNEWIAQWLDRIDATTADLVLLVITAASLAAGWWARRRFAVNSWFAYSTGLSIGGLWLVSVAVARTTPWAVPLGLVLGVGAAVVGAWGRLGAPLVGGTAIAIGTFLVGYGNYVGSVPLWVWLGVGGFVLMGVAVAVERGSKQGATLSDLINRWQ